MQTLGKIYKTAAFQKEKLLFFCWKRRSRGI